jgi:histidine triad (HIT) family protein
MGTGAIASAAVPDCIFCAIVAGDMPAEIVDSDEHTITLMDINPATKGHALVIPRRHSEDLLSISEDDLIHCATAAQRIARRMEETLEPDGFNLLNATRAAGWQTVFHFHIHVIPRYENDPLKLPWIPRGAEMDEIAAIAATIREGK